MFSCALQSIFQDFDELAALADAGDSMNIDETLHDLSPSENNNDYGKINSTIPNVPIFRFGKLASNDLDLGKCYIICCYVDDIISCKHLFFFV